MYLLLLAFIPFFQKPSFRRFRRINVANAICAEGAQRATHMSAVGRAGPGSRRAAQIAPGCRLIA